MTCERPDIPVVGNGKDVVAAGHKNHSVMCQASPMVISTVFSNLCKNPALRKKCPYSELFWLLKRVEEHEKIRLGNLFDYHVSLNKFLNYLRVFVYIRSLLKLIFLMECRQNINKPHRQ